MLEKRLKLTENRKFQVEDRNEKGKGILERQTISIIKAKNIEELFGETKSTL